MIDPDQEALAAALIQLAAHAERICDLDSREATHHDDLAAQVGELVRHAAAAGSRIDAITKIIGHHASVVNAIDGLDQQVTTIASQLDNLTALASKGGAAYQPVSPPRWWHLTDDERQGAVARLRDWIDQIYRPGYGHLASALPACWEHHPLCLYTLDWLSELWSALYLEPQRTTSTLPAQAEWQTRLLAAAVSQMRSEANGCRHLPGAGGPDAKL